MNLAELVDVQGIDKPDKQEPYERNNILHRSAVFNKSEKLLQIGS
jgi:hypothetical protein